MRTMHDDFHKHGTVCVSTDCWKRSWTMGANSLLHSLRHLPLILSGPGAFFGLIFASSFLTSSTCSVIGCPFSLFRVSNSSARSRVKSVVSNRAKKMFISFATWFSFSTQILFSFSSYHLTSYHLQAMPHLLSFP